MFLIFLQSLKDVDMPIIFHALKPEPLELPGILLDVFGILLHSKHKFSNLSKSKAFLFAASDRHEYAYRKMEAGDESEFHFTQNLTWMGD